MILMTNFFSSKAIITKEKAMYGRRLTQKDFDELIHKQAVSEVAGYLKNETHYGRALKSIQESTIHRSQLENLLQRDTFRRYLRLIRYDRTTNSFYRFVIIEMEISQLLNCLLHLNAAISEDLIISIPGFLFDDTSFDMMALAKVKTYGQLLELLKKTPYHDVLLPLTPENGDRINLPACEVALKRFYFDRVTRLIGQYSRGKTKLDLNSMVSAQAELENITSIYRLKRFFNADEEMVRQYILPYRYIISAKNLEALICAPSITEFFKVLKRSKYGAYLREDQKENFAKGIEEVRYLEGKKNIRFSNDAKTAFLAFVILSRIELHNLTNIIEGVRYGLPPDEIKSLLIL